MKTKIIKIRCVEEAILAIAVIYIVIYPGITFYLWTIGFQITITQQTIYFVGFFLFIISVYFAFTEFMSRSVGW